MARSRTLPVLLVGALTVAVVGACQAPGGTDDQTLTYWSMWKEGEPQQLVLAQAIEDFESETGITVDVQWQGRDNTTKVVPTLNTHSVPDLIDGSFAKLAPVLAATGQAAPLTDAFATVVEDDVTVADLIPTAYLDGTGIDLADGSPWMVPYSLTSDAFWFDAAQHPELVEEPPATWNDLIEELDELSAQGETPIAVDGDVSGYNAYWYTSAIVRLAGAGSLEAMAQDPTAAAWDSAEALAAAQLVEQLVDGGYFIEGYDASKWPAQQQAWGTDDAALLFNGTWIPTETSTYVADGFEFASFPFPTLEGQEQTYQRADFIGFAVPAAADGADAAQQLAAYFLQQQYQDALGTEARVLPVRDDVAVSEEMAGVQADLAAADAYYQQNDGITLSGYTEKVYFPICDKLLLGTVDAEEFIAQMKAAQIEYWETNS